MHIISENWERIFYFQYKVDIGQCVTKSPAFDWKLTTVPWSLGVPRFWIYFLSLAAIWSGVRFLFLFVLTDAILLEMDLQKRTNDLDNPANQKLFV